MVTEAEVAVKNGTATEKQQLLFKQRKACAIKGGAAKRAKTGA
jgi:hypothetical protein